MKARWFTRLSPRERRLIGVAVPLLAWMLGWALIWHPLGQARDQWRERAAELGTDVAWMRQAVAVIGASQIRAREGLGPRSLLAAADTSLREAGLGGALRRIEPLNERRVRVWFEQAPFDTVTSWLEGLDRRHGIQVPELSASRREGAGMVDIRVTLEVAP